jgi:hypothetical protein
VSQAVSRRIYTEVAHVPAHVTSLGFVMDKVVLGKFFSYNVCFPTNPHSTDGSTLIMIHHPGLVQ